MDAFGAQIRQTDGQWDAEREKERAVQCKWHHVAHLPAQWPAVRAGCKLRGGWKKSKVCVTCRTNEPKLKTRLGR